MADRTIAVRGPFSDDEIARLIGVLQEIEELRPEDTFQLILDEPQATEAAAETLERMRQINPLRPGYQRTIEIMPLGDGR